MDLYAENILDHYKHPRMKGSLKDATVSHQEENASCGDDLTVDLRFEGTTLKEILWRGNGCALSQASMSILSEELAGKTTEELEAITPAHIYEILGVPVGPRRFKCALLSLHTLKNALRVQQDKQPQSWIETVQVEN
jgi:nitrogen fixation NifU-like protein